MRIVIKIGTNLLTGTGTMLDRKLIGTLAAQIAALHGSGSEIILVSSGAVGAGLMKLNLKKRPSTLRGKQAASAVGQPLLMQLYGEYFNKYDITTAQILLTREDFDDRNRYLNLRNTMLGLLDMGVIPVVNENDTVSVEEIKFGDNDTLSALVAVKVEADKLVILTDVDGLYTSDPRRSKEAELVAEVRAITPEIEKFARKSVGSSIASGGMDTKVQAAKIAAASGIETIIANGTIKDVLIRTVKNKEPLGTRFLAACRGMDSRKKWIAFGTKVRGKLVLDDGAVDAIVKRGKSLLPKGIVTVEGRFSKGDKVSLLSRKGMEIARGLVNYSADDINKVKGKNTSQMAGLLNRRGCDEIIHRDNLVVWK